MNDITDSYAIFPTPHHTAHTARFVVLCLLMGLLTYWIFQDVQSRLVPRAPTVITVSAPTAVPLCRVSYVRQCRYDSTVGSFVVEMTDEGPHVATVTP